MNIVAQMFNVPTGERSQPVKCSRAELAAILRTSCEKNQIDPGELIVIVLLEQFPDSEEWQHTLAPLIRGDEFINYFGAQANG